MGNINFKILLVNKKKTLRLSLQEKLNLILKINTL